MNPTIKFNRLYQKHISQYGNSKLDLLNYVGLMKLAGYEFKTTYEIIKRRAIKEQVKRLDLQLNIVREVYSSNDIIPKFKTPGKHTKEEWTLKIQQYNSKCFYCGKKTNKLTKDHVVPKSRGGSNNIDNIVPSCWPCNYTKRAKSVELFKEGVTLKFI